MLSITQPIESIEIVSASDHDVARINSISYKHSAERQESKATTFALTR